MADGYYYDDYYYYYYDYNYNSSEVFSCSMADFMAKLDQHPLLKAEKIVSTILAVIGIVVNMIGLSALIRQNKSKKDRSIRSRIILLMSLSMSDIAVCVAVLIHLYVNYALMMGCMSSAVRACTKAFVDALIPACTILCLLNLLGMAIDHWLTFTKPFQYFEMMSRKRTMVMVTSFWVFALFLLFSEYLSGLQHLSNPKFADLHYCELVGQKESYYRVEYVLLAVAPLCLIAMVIIYCSIFREIQQLVVAPPRQQDFGQARRALYTTLVILGTFIVCWLPCYTSTAAYYLYLFLGSHEEKWLTLYFKIHEWFFALLITNSILDPLIYMSNLRMKLKGFCRTVTSKIRHRYDAVQMVELRRDEAPTSHTLTTVRSSIQITPACNLLQTDPVNSASNGY